MVSSNCGTPDPDKPPEDVAPVNDIIIASDTDTEEEDNGYSDYRLLPMNDANSDRSEDSDENETQIDQSLPQETTMEEALVREVWAGSAPVDIEMDTDKVNQVKEAMMNFTLPASSIPEWAHSIPEEEWKEQLMNKLQLTKS